MVAAHTAPQPLLQVHADCMPAPAKRAAAVAAAGGVQALLLVEAAVAVVPRAAAP